MGFGLSLLIDELARREAELRAKHRIIPKLLLEKELKVKARIGKAVVAAIYNEYPPFLFTVLRFLTDQSWNLTLRLFLRLRT